MEGKEVEAEGGLCFMTLRGDRPPLPTAIDLCNYLSPSLYVCVFVYMCLCVSACPGGRYGVDCMCVCVCQRVLEAGMEWTVCVSVCVCMYVCIWIYIAQPLQPKQSRGVDCSYGRQICHITVENYLKISDKYSGKLSRDIKRLTSQHMVELPRDKRQIRHRCDQTCCCQYGGREP